MRYTIMSGESDKKIECPRCKKSEGIVEVKRNAVVENLFPDFKHYHCTDCQNNFYEQTKLSSKTA